MDARHRLVKVTRNSPIFVESTWCSLGEVERDVNMSTVTVEQLFAKNWHRWEKYRPDVQFIFEIQWPEHALRPYLTYRYCFSHNTSAYCVDELSFRAKVQASTHAENGLGNEKFLFHGTNRACMLGESPSTVLLCCRKQCSLCSILRTSLTVSKCGKLFKIFSSHPFVLKRLQGTKNAFKRYAKVLDVNLLRYHSYPGGADTGTADEYVSNLSQSTSLRVMLINRVVIGNAYKTHRNAPRIVPLSPEYNSVRD
ncbi:hypothetical protein J3R82DRAFT_1542 [Butyriboletus roseoflavus]|nr:hypothetical protein J3R82DRAFT_1542 [Butyriboletus roseoflavus]